MSRAQDVARALNAKGPNASGRWKAKCPIHNEKKGESLSFNEDCYRCHGAKCGAKGHISELLRHLGMPVERGAPNGDSTAEAYRLIEAQAGHKKETLDRYGVSYQRGAWSFPYPGGSSKRKRTESKIFYWQGTEDQKKRRTLFGLEVAKSFGSSTLYVVEGEKDVITMGQCQIPAVCFSDGCDSVPKRAALEAIMESGFTEACVVYDADDGGDTGRWKAADALKAHGLNVTVRDLPQGNGHPPGYDITNFFNENERDPKRFAQGIEDLAVAPRPPAVWDAIKRPLYPEPSPLPLDALVPVLRAQAASVAASIEVPTDVTVLLSVLSVSAAIGGKIELRLNESWRREWSVLYGIVLLKTGERKSPAFEAMTGAISEWERDAIDAMRDTHEFKIAMVEVEQERLKRAKKGVQNNPSDEDAKNELEAALKDLRNAKEAVPNSPRLLVDDATVEALVIRMAGNEGRAALLSPEGGALKIINGLYSDGGARLEEFKKSWSGERIDTDRVGREGVSVPRPALTLGLCCQPSVLNDLSKKDTMRNEGFFGRILSVSPKSLVGTRDMANQPKRDVKADKRYADALRVLLEAPWNYDEHERKIPWPLQFSEEAVSALIAYQAELEPEMAGGRRLGGIADWANKAHGQAARIAALQTMAERASKKEDLFTGRIGVDAVNAAVRLMRCLTDHALHVLGQLGADRQTGDLTYVLSRRKDLGEEATTRDLFRSMSRPSIATMEDLDPLVNELVNRGYFKLKYPPPQGEKGGRPPSPTLLLNPLVNLDKTDKTSDSPSSVGSVEADGEDEDAEYLREERACMSEF